LTAAASVPKLAAMQFVIDEIHVDGKGSGQSGNEGEKRLSVRFTGGVEAQHRKLGTSSVAAACLRVQQERSEKQVSFR
jgi:hypothetical protein